MARTTHDIRTQSNQAVLAADYKPTIRFIKRQEVESITGLSCTEIYRRIATGNFPKQVVLGPKCVVWDNISIYAWMNDRIAESRAVV
jgi:prophage regulatory protein